MKYVSCENAADKEIAHKNEFLEVSFIFRATRPGTVLKGFIAASVKRVARAEQKRFAIVPANANNAGLQKGASKL